MPNCNTNNMSVFRYNEDIVILVCDEAVWHKSKNLEISGNIIMTHIPPTRNEPLRINLETNKDRWG